MAYLKVNQQKAKKFGTKRLLALCPFRAFEETESGGIVINAGCKMCRLCVKNAQGAVELIEESGIDKSTWNGVSVFAEVVNGRLHPVAAELLGEARRLADKAGQKVYALLIGSGLNEAVEKLKYAGADALYVYDELAFHDFLLERYANAFADFIEHVRPSCVLAGSTNLGRVLAPRVAARLKTGLTADCTMLDLRENTDLVQTRPAFGGNIMAQIVTKNARPQFCTVRHKIFSALKEPYTAAETIYMDTSDISLTSGAESIKIRPRGAADDLSGAEVVIAVGRGVRSADLPLVKELARRLNASIGCTRPLVEAKSFDARCQIGLSGRTVRPRLIIALGVSGSVQFAAGMQGSELIIAVNNDENAPIFSIAHVSVVADCAKVLPELLSRMEEQA